MTPLPKRPLPHGSPAHEAWCIAAVLELADRAGVAVEKARRDVLYQHMTSDDGNSIMCRDFKACGGYSRVRALAAQTRAGSAAAVPLAAVPRGYEVARVSSTVGLDGAVRGQSIQAKPATRRGEVAPQRPDGHALAGVSTLVDGSGRIVGQWMKTARERETREQILERLLRELPEVIGAREPVTPPVEHVDADLLAVYPLGDPHIGMLSWHEETGADFDLTIARRIFGAAMRDLVERGPRAKQALIVNLGDFFHSDTLDNRTRRSGHALDVDSRWPKILQVGVEIMIGLVDRALEHHARVRVINEIGNHDDHTAIMLSVALRAYYRAEPRVDVDASPARRHWHRHGRCLIGVTHGDGAKPEQLESIMAAERPDDWGATRHRYWYCGHVHHSRRIEHRGCVVESFRTLAPRDAWAAGMGYRAGRDLHRIVLHSEHGEVSREIASADYLAARYREAV